MPLRCQLDTAESALNGFVHTADVFQIIVKEKGGVCCRLLVVPLEQPGKICFFNGLRRLAGSVVLARQAVGSSLSFIFARSSWQNRRASVVGVFTNVTSPSTKAKLRILFEVAPLSLLVSHHPRSLMLRSLAPGQKAQAQKVKVLSWT